MIKKIDVIEGVLFATCIAPFPLLGIFIAPWWAWAIYSAWILAVMVFPRKKKKRKTDFQHFKIEGDFYGRESERYQGNNQLHNDDVKTA